MQPVLIRELLCALVGTRVAAAACLLALQLACEEEPEPVQPPTEDEIEALVDLGCTMAYVCFDLDSEEVAALVDKCKTKTGLRAKLTPEENPECEDVWLVYEFHECWASLSCADYIKGPQSPGDPCHEELTAADKANCSLF